MITRICHLSHVLEQDLSAMLGDVVATLPKSEYCEFVNLKGELYTELLTNLKWFVCLYVARQFRFDIHQSPMLLASVQIEIYIGNLIPHTTDEMYQLSEVGTAT
jgi:hypothetical protein